MHLAAIVRFMNLARHVILCLVALGLSACGSLPQSGPTTKAFASDQFNSDGRIQQITVTPEVIQVLAQNRTDEGFASNLPRSGATSSNSEPLLGVGDALEISIWEAPPATLFAGAETASRGSTTNGARSITLPEQTIGADGMVRVPFAGDVPALGRIPSLIAADVVNRLRGKAHQPQVLVRLIKSTSALVTVVGEVNNSARIPLSARGERLLDAIAAVGGSKQPIHKTTLQMTRGTTTVAMPMERVIREPQQNILLQAGDIITAIFQPFSFTALGATTQNAEVNFEAQGITLAQAVSRVGGLQDARADAKGVFIFRMESNDAVNKLNKKDGISASLPGAQAKIPVIYQIDLKKPESFFLAQNFAVENKDLLYISNAPAADWQKFANLIYTIALPAVNTANAIR
jgi:polysaccharide biosynthesis/export protein